MKIHWPVELFLAQKDVPKFYEKHFSTSHLPSFCSCCRVKMVTTMHCRQRFSDFFSDDSTGLKFRKKFSAEGKLWLTQWTSGFGTSLKAFQFHLWQRGTCIFASFSNNAYHVTITTIHCVSVKTTKAQRCDLVISANECLSGTIVNSKAARICAPSKVTLIHKV